jgi:hypothetical protein
MTRLKESCPSSATGSIRPRLLTRQQECTQEKMIVTDPVSVTIDLASLL